MTLILENLSHVYGDNKTLKGLSLTVEPKEVMCLLGPSGCGKTTLLRLVAGLERLTDGRIRIDETTLATSDLHPAPEKRPVGLVFQEHALFPHMSVAENIEFGLKSLSLHARQARRKELIDMVGLTGLDDRKPGTLSGGQQQRVALARALAPSPAIMLLDEPYASVDVVLRRSLRESARVLLKRAESAAILVTHDPDEALEMADRIAVMSDGRILQVDTPDKIINSPRNAEVASLFGEAQTFEGSVSDGVFNSEAGPFQLGVIDRNDDTDQSDTLVTRPAGLSFRESNSGPWEVRDIRYRSTGEVLFLSVDDSPSAQLVRVDASFSENYAIGMRGELSLQSHNAFLFRRKS